MVRKSNKARKGGAAVLDAPAPSFTSGETIPPQPAAPQTTNVADFGNTAPLVQARAIPQGKLQAFPISRLFRRDNVRTPGTENVLGMVESLRRHGFKMNHPIVVSIQSDAGKNEPDGLVIAGNRRVMGAESLAEQYPEEFAKMFPSGTIPAVVHTGLTQAQEALLRNDHSKDEDRQALDPWGEFLAVRQLVKYGYNEREISDLMGFTKPRKSDGIVVVRKGYAQQRIHLAKLPQVVQDAFELQLTKPAAEQTDASRNVRWQDIEGTSDPVAGKPGLFNAWNADFNAGKLHGDGPLFTLAWNSILQRVAGVPNPVKALSPSAASEMAKARSSATFKEILTSVVKNDNATEIVDLDAKLSKLETDSETLAAIRKHLGAAKFKALVTEAIGK